MSFDTDGIRRSIAISDMAARYGVALKQDGREFKGCCPFHEESTPSFTVYPAKKGGQLFFCFGCGAAGDVIDFVMHLKGVNLPTACEILGGRKDAPDNRPALRLDNRSIYDGIVPLDNGGSHPFVVGQVAQLWNPKRGEMGRFAPTHVHEYRAADGSLFGLVLRRTVGDGKETPTVRFVKLPDGRSLWSRFPFGERRPIYGLADLGRAQQVTIVEGEKCRDAFARAVRRPVVSWAGGGKAVRFTDWSPLAGRHVILWPDADMPGRQTMEQLADMLHLVGAAGVRLMRLPAARVE